MGEVAKLNKVWGMHSNDAIKLVDDEYIITANNILHVIIKAKNKDQLIRKSILNNKTLQNALIYKKGKIKYNLEVFFLKKHGNPLMYIHLYIFILKVRHYLAVKKKLFEAQIIN